VWLFSGGLSADERRHLRLRHQGAGKQPIHVHRASYNRPLSFQGGRVEDKAHEDKTTERMATETGRSKRGILWMLAGLAVAGAAVIYKWWRGLPK